MIQAAKIIGLIGAGVGAGVGIGVVFVSIVKITSVIAGLASPFYGVMFTGILGAAFGVLIFKVSNITCLVKGPQCYVLFASFILTVIKSGFLCAIVATPLMFTCFIFNPCVALMILSMWSDVTRGRLPNRGEIYTSVVVSTIILLLVQYVWPELSCSAKFIPDVISVLGSVIAAYYVDGIYAIGGEGTSLPIVLSMEGSSSGSAGGSVPAGSSAGGSVPAGSSSDELVDKLVKISRVEETDYIEKERARLKLKVNELKTENSDSAPVKALSFCGIIKPGEQSELIRLDIDLRKAVKMYFTSAKDASDLDLFQMRMAVKMAHTERGEFYTGLFRKYVDSLPSKALEEKAIASRQLNQACDKTLLELAGRCYPGINSELHWDIVSTRKRE